jgi:hypothetical protein
MTPEILANRIDREPHLHQHPSSISSKEILERQTSVKRRLINNIPLSHFATLLHIPSRRPLQSLASVTFKELVAIGESCSDNANRYLRLGKALCRHTEDQERS